MAWVFYGFVDKTQFYPAEKRACKLSLIDVSTSEVGANSIVHGAEGEIYICTKDDYKII